MNLTLSTKRIEDYRRFLRVKSLPNYRFQGRTATVPDEYAHWIDEAAKPSETIVDVQPDLFSECRVPKA